MFFWTCLKETKAQTSWTDKSGRGRACLGPSLPSSVLPPAPWLAAAVIPRLWELTNSLFVLSDVLEFHFWTLPVLWQNVANVLVLTTEELRVLTSRVSVCLNNRYCFCHQCAQKARWCRCWAVFSPLPGACVHAPPTVGGRTRVSTTAPGAPPQLPAPLPRLGRSCFFGSWILF